MELRLLAALVLLIGASFYRSVYSRNYSIARGSLLFSEHYAEVTVVQPLRLETEELDTSPYMMASHILRHDQGQSN